MTDQGLIKLLSELVAIPSVNPRITDDGSIAGEGRMADFFAGYLERLGFAVTREFCEPGRPNVIAVRGPERPRRTLLLESHLDTVGVAGMSGAPFASRVERGRLYGRGACDTKGPMAAALWALAHTDLDALSRAGWRLIYAGTMGEETGNEGAEALAASGLRADEAVILEPTELAIIHAHKGALWFRVTVKGRAAHGSNPGRGLNAIEGMESVIALLREQVEREARGLAGHTLGEPTLNIGVIRGGEAVNIVPAECSIEVDRRTLPGEDSEAVLARVRAGLQGLVAAGTIAGFEVAVMKNGRPFATRSDSSLVGRLKKSCEMSGQGSKLDGVAWYSNAGALAGVCAELVVFGPGSIVQAHTADEYIDLASLQGGAEALRRFFELTIADFGS
ncbi:MAG: M20 family metallopeptidase [Kiritimatiellae bacterium]|nr:M20 family metallopeptidase [Kiritimatiellia bacterium]